VQSIEQRRTDGQNSFHSALQTDRVVAMILAESTGGVRQPGAAAVQTIAPPPRNWLMRLLGR
jgi:hypothetical protein